MALLRVNVARAPPCWSWTLTQRYQPLGVCVCVSVRACVREWECVRVCVCGGWKTPRWKYTHTHIISTPKVQRSMSESRLREGLTRRTEQHIRVDRHSTTKLGRWTAVMSGQPRFVSPFHRPRCLAAAAAPAGKAKLTHPGKAILAGKEVCVAEAGV